MADLDLRREHGLSLDEAKSKVEDILDEEGLFRNAKSQ